MKSGANQQDIIQMGKMFEDEMTVTEISEALGIEEVIVKNFMPKKIPVAPVADKLPEPKSQANPLKAKAK